MLHDSTAASPRLLPGAEVIARIRRVLVVALIAVFVYAALSTGSKSYCPGGFGGNGGFIDSVGNPTTQPPMCISLALQPSPLIFIGVALIVFLALGRVRKATDEPAAIRTLDRAAAGIVILVVCALTISRVWFGLISVTDLDPNSFQIFAPFPFGLIDVVTSPMQGP